MRAAIVILVALAVSAGSVAAYVIPEGAPQTGPENPYPNSAQQSILTGTILVKNVTGDQPEQIRLSQASPTEMWVMWSSGDSFIGPVDTATPGQAAADAQPTPRVQYSKRSGGPYQTKKGTKSVHTITFFYNPVNFTTAANYTSPVQHLVKIDGLEPDTTYYYKVGDGTKANTSPEHSFTTLPAVGHDKSIRIGVFGDLGDSTNSTSTLQHLAANKPAIILNMGDLTYADKHGPPFNATTDILAKDKSFKNANIFNTATSITDGRRWDGWGRLTEFLFNSVPHHSANGNHEIEEDSLGHTFGAYKTRYPAPGTAVQPLANGKVTGNTEFWYSIEFAGVHVLFLTPYFDHTPGSAQYKWLVNDLKSIDRQKTPWVIAVEHHPWYTTLDGGDYRGNECMRQYFEPLFYEYGVDFMLNGHVHSYDRSFPVRNYTVDPCGTVNIVIGDGGNAGSVSDGYADGAHGGSCPGYVATPPGVDPGPDPNIGDFAKYPTLGYCNATVTNPGIPWCFSSQPTYSAYREPSYGHAIITIHNANRATWEWNRNQDGIPVITDSFTLVRDTKQCPNKAAPSKRGPSHIHEHDHDDDNHGRNDHGPSKDGHSNDSKKSSRKFGHH